jgi:hypothetical protein
MLAYVVDVSLLCVKTLPKNPCRTSLLLILKMIWCNVSLSLPEPQNLLLVNHVIALSAISLSVICVMPLESFLFRIQLPLISKCLSA